MDLRLRIASLTSNLGDVVELDEAGVTCIVGPNNVGKSKLLREIRRFIAAFDDEDPVVLSSLQLRRTLKEQIGEGRAELQSGSYSAADDSEVKAWLELNSGAFGLDQFGLTKYTPRGGGNPIAAQDFVTSLFYNSRLDSNVAPFFFSESSVGLGQLSGSFHNPMGNGELDASYLAIIHRSSEREVEISQAFEEVFGEPLTYDQATGFNGLRLGKVDASLLSEGRFTDAFTAEMRRLRRLGLQGQGMQAFMGPVAALVLGGAQVLLMDEPETYLHPPQARALGRMIGRDANERDRQVIVVTHDRDFVVGLLESRTPLRFVRIAREGQGNRLTQVATGDVKWIWDSAVLRYSNVLSGLFYRHVVICESDADCRFYGAVLDDLVETGQVERSANETLFVPSGGKAGVEPRVRALEKLRVSIAVVLDFDILADAPNDLKKIVEGLGRVWTSADVDDFNRVKKDIVERSARDVVKNAGVAALSPGPVTEAALRLLGNLADRGVHVVPVGEMESFDRRTALQKERWVEYALEAGLHRTAGDHQELVKRASKGVA